MEIDKSDTAIVFIDPQNDVLSEKGANWAAVGQSVTENKTVENMERIFIAARDKGILSSYPHIISTPRTTHGKSTARLRQMNSRPIHSPQRPR
ncbi:MAG: hypothetical protein WDN49_06910 [Acetobacteraceae bacterium]